MPITMYSCCPGPMGWCYWFVELYLTEDLPAGLKLWHISLWKAMPWILNLLAIKVTITPLEAHLLGHISANNHCFVGDDSVTTKISWYERYIVFISVLATLIWHLTKYYDLEELFEIIIYFKRECTPRRNADAILIGFRYTNLALGTLSSCQFQKAHILCLLYRTVFGRRPVTSMFHISIDNK